MLQEPEDMSNLIPREDIVLVLMKVNFVMLTGGNIGDLHMSTHQHADKAPVCSFKFRYGNMEY